MRTLSRAEAKAFYDRFGARQDRQAFYEDAALAEMIHHGAFERARAVVEVGCGTGRLAATLLERSLPADCSYLAIDISETMTGLARDRLAPWRGRAEVRLSSGALRVEAPDGAFDRVVATYLLDLLSERDIRALLVEAHRVLAPGGRLCLVGLTEGATLPARAVAWAWRRLHALRPALVGGCRPLRLDDVVPATRWRIAHHGIVTRFAISSEILVAVRRT